jgi:CHAT domain-containing protein
MRRLLFAFKVALFTLFLSGHSSLAQSPADAAAASPTMTRIFVHAWTPEFGRISVPANSPQEKLFDVADLVQQGDFKAAETLLSSIEASTGDPRIKFLANLFAQQLWQRRYALLSGARKPDGDSRLDEMKYQVAIEESMPRLNSLAQQMTTADAADAFIALRYSQTIDICLVEEVGSRRSRTAQPELLGPDAPPNSNPGLFERAAFIDPLSGLNLEAFLWDALGRTQQDLLLHNVKGQIAAGEFDFAGARASFEAGLAQALRENQPRSAAEFMLRLGDLEAAPYGDVRTFGYNIVAELSVRGRLSQGFIPRVTLTPTKSALDAAEARYRQAEEMFDRLGERLSTHRITIRRAHLARMRGDMPLAVTLYRRAAEQAVADNAPRDAAIAQASQALLSGERAPFMEALKALFKRGDLGAVNSVVEMGNSWAARLWYFNRDFQGAVTRLHMVADALSQDDVNLGRLAADALQTLSTIYGETGRVESSIQVAQQAIDAQARHIAATEKAYADFSRTHPSVTTDFFNLEKIRYVSNLSAVSRGIYTLTATEGSPHWKEMLDGLDSRLELAYRDLPDQLGTRRLFELIKQNSRTLFDTRSLISNTRTCQGLLRHYDEIRAKLAGLDRPFPRWQLDAQVGPCAPEKLQAARAELRSQTPVEELRRALAAHGPNPGFAARMNVIDKMSSLEGHFETALMLESYDLLGRWVDEMTALIDRDTSLQYLRAPVQAYRAGSLMGQTRFAEARALIRDLIADERSWAVRPAPSKIAVLNILVEAESQLGNAEASLLALEQVRFEQEHFQALRSGVEAGVRRSAELAMLERRAASEGGLTPSDLQRLQELRVEVERDAANSTGARRPPSLQDLRAALRALPEKTTLLVYSVGTRQIIVWRAAANQPLTATRLNANARETIQLVRGLEEDLISDFPGWAAKSAKLFDSLITPVGPLPKGETLVFSVQGPLATIPFEVLGASPNALLLGDHPISYVAHLTNPAGEQAAATPGANRTRKALVVGPSGADLPNAEAEAIEVARKLGVRPLLGSGQATSQKILEAIKDATWVHFSTHGTIEESNPYLSRIALPDGDRIEAWQLFRDAPRAEMIVLSACDTKREARANLSVQTGETTTLNRFAFAGDARWVVASLWSANDLTSAEIIREFYRLMIDEGVGKAEALQRAKLKLATSEAVNRPNHYAHFVLSAHDLFSLKN